MQSWTYKDDTDDTLTPIRCSGRLQGRTCNTFPTVEFIFLLKFSNIQFIFSQSWIPNFLHYAAASADLTSEYWIYRKVCRPQSSKMYTYILFIIPFFNKNLNWFGELFDICSTSACSLQNLPRTGSGAPLFYEHWDNPGLPVISSHIWLPAFSQSGAELCLIREVSSEYNCFPQRGVNTISPSLSLSKLPQIPDINSVSPLSPVRLY